MDEDENYVVNQEIDMEYNFQKTFGWYAVLNRIVGNDFTKHEYVYQKNLTEVLNQLSYLVQYDQEQMRLQKKAMGQIS
jgi:hypothetical protein